MEGGEYVCIHFLSRGATYLEPFHFAIPLFHFILQKAPKVEKQNQRIQIQ